MSERVILESQRSTSQRQMTVERRLNRLNLRAWTGALRTAQTAVTLSPPPAQPSTILSMTVSSGRWKLSLRGAVAFTSTGNEVINVAIYATGGTGLLPEWKWQVPVVGDVVVPVCDEGEARIAEDEGIFTVAVWGTGAAIVEFRAITLFALPV